LASTSELITISLVHIPLKRNLNMAKKRKAAKKKVTKNKATTKTARKAPDGPPGPYTKTDRAVRRFLREIGADPNRS